MLKVWCDSVNFVVAGSAEDAVGILAKLFGLTAEERAVPEQLRDHGIDPAEEWHALPDDKVISIGDDDPPRGAPNRRTMTCAEWCQVEGRGFHASTEW